MHMQINKSSVIKLIVGCLTISLCQAYYFCDQLEAVPNCSCYDSYYKSELSCLADPDIVLRLDYKDLEIICKAPKELKLEIFPKISNIQAESLVLVNCSLSKNTTFEHILQQFDVKDINSLIQDSADIGSLSVGSLSGLSHFETVSIIDSNITALHEDSFNEMGNMTILTLERNKLKYLPVNVFSSLQNLEELYLSENELERLSAGTFRNQGKLKILNLRTNRLRTLANGTFQGLSSLNYLEITHNKLKYLPVNVFSSLQNLEELYLSENELERLSAGTFRNQGKLENLNLSKNRLRTLANGTFQGLSSLNYLEITHNKLTTLANGVFDDIATLAHLDLSSNELTSISRSAHELLLSILWADFDRESNLIAKLPCSTVFEKLNNLNELLIDDNKLASIHANAFVNNVHLHEIRLCKNRLSFGVGVSNSPFRNLNELYSLYLDENSITTILSDWRNLEELSILSLRDNTIESLNYENLNFKGEEVDVHLEGNNIKDLQVPHDAKFPNGIDVFITKIDCCQSDLSRLSSTFKIDDLQCTSPQSMLDEFVDDIYPLRSVCDVKE